MIKYSLSPAAITTGKRSRVTFSLVNPGPGTCTSVAVYLGFPTEINLIDGRREIKESRLPVGETKPYLLEIIGKAAGPSYIEISSMSYFGPDGKKVKISAVKIPVEILEQKQPAQMLSVITLSPKVYKYQQWDILEGTLLWHGNTLPNNVRLQTSWPLECREPLIIERIENVVEHPFRLYVRPMEFGEHVPAKIVLNGVSGITLYEQSIDLKVEQEGNTDHILPNNNDKQIDQDLERGVIRIFNQKGNTAGTGFVIGEHLAVTCAHVAAAALQETPGLTLETAAIHIQYHYDKSEQAAELANLETGADDIAFLRLVQLPEGVMPLKLVPTGKPDGHEYASLGYPKDSGPAANRKPRGLINGIVDAEEKGRQPLLELKGEEFYYGSSGSPVLDLNCGKVVGMVTSHKSLEHTKLVYATTADTIQMFCSKLAINQLTHESGETRDLK